MVKTERALGLCYTLLLKERNGPVGDKVVRILHCRKTRGREKNMKRRITDEGEKKVR